MAEDEGFKIDHEGFEAAMKEQQERARASVVKGGSMGMQNETFANITEPSEFLAMKLKLPESWLSVIVADDARHDSVNCWSSPPCLCNKHHSTLKWVDK